MSKPSEYKEGDVVTCPDMAKPNEGAKLMTTGTIVLIALGEVSVLDAAGFIHKVKVGQIYRAQN